MFAGKAGGKGLPGTNALACYEKSYLTVVKSFTTLRPDGMAIDAAGHLWVACFGSAQVRLQKFDQF
jgi:sugar lactone lactonase YvrE